MLEYLFGSKTRVKMLKTFFAHQNKSFYVRELSRLLNSQINAVRRELELLVKAGIIKETKDHNNQDYEQGSSLRKYYILDTSSLLYLELQALLQKAQLMGEQKFIETIQNRGGEIDLFIITGKFLNDKTSPSDLLLVGNLKERNIVKIIEDYEKDSGLELRFTIMTTSEFNDRRRVMDKFLYAIFEAQNLKIIDKITN
ncbi:MAG TPA: hypothetical protein PK831_00290 [Candidatus Magasanikbacteria bacterium]|jgi:predicted transcriptional regulator|nr:hypothetical protein [Candidatus Magasanikbacteria bacterium]HQF56933.1 hypothetical protein [Candidatus Magasanikbacteria bacterium]HQL52783.1 hypothetical protein [Candidatus Magasanikbacteria bacterium]